jgi:hypothetical protein
MTRQVRSRLVATAALGTALCAGVSANAWVEPATPTPAQAQPSDARVWLDGHTYRFAGGDAQRAALHDAIQRVTSSLNFIERRVGRGRLTARNPVYDSIAFHFRGDQIEVDLGGRPFRSPDNGAPASGRAITGEPVQIHQRVEGARLVQVLQTSEGERRTEFVPSADGRRVAMHVTLRTRKLQSPLRYELSYAR